MTTSTTSGMSDTSQVRRRVLLVDDENLFLRALDRSLRNKYETTTAVDATSALARLETASFDAVVSDDHMPGRMGHDFLREVAERWPSTVRILMTGLASVEVTIEAVNGAQIAGFVKKPLRPLEIEHCLEAAFSHQIAALQKHSLVIELTRKRDELERLVALLRMDPHLRQDALLTDNQRLHVVAQRDALTGLLNRHGLSQALALAERTPGIQEQYSVLYIDVDRFKAYNDRYGHPAGDGLLRSIAGALEKTLRREGGDLIARYGGEEFVVVAGTGLSTGLAIAERLRRGVEAQTVATVSIGVAAAPDHGESFSAVLEAADRALYLAKSQGRNRVVVTTSGSQHEPACAPVRACR
jgi:diguanylate cyclase (GGDEF)-like protein